MNLHQALLLDLLASVGEITRHRVETLTDSDWDALLSLANDHRLEPMLYHNALSRNLEDLLPNAVQEQWRRSQRHSAIKILKQEQALFEVTALLDKLEVPFYLLKGAWLARKVYSSPALRPMRDIDILVPETCAIEAFEMLLSNGFSRLPDDNMPTRVALATHKHLPPLLHLDTGVLIEIHTKILSHQTTQIPLEEFSIFQISANKEASDSKIISHFLSIEMNIFHIISHAICEHFFNNGPVFISDINHILRTQKIRWEYFWMLAESGGMLQGTFLAFDLVERYHGPQAIVWPEARGEKTPPEVLDAAAELSVQPRESRESNALKADLARSRTQKQLAPMIIRRLLPPRHILAAEMQLDAESRMAWLGYPKWFFKRVARYAPKAHRNRAEVNLHETIMPWIFRPTGS